MVNGRPSDAARPRRSALESRITEQGYRSGPMQRQRDKNTDSLFRKFPELKRRVFEHPASRSWNENRLLSFDERLDDGFCARFAEEFLIYDRREDHVLDEFIYVASARIRGEKTPKAKVLAASEMVADVFGNQPEFVARNWRQRLDEAQLPEGEMLRVGWLMKDPSGGSRGFPGAGKCRHRSFLLKYLLDALEVCPCAAVSGVIVPEGIKDVTKFRREHGFADHAWNCVRLGHEVMLLDVMNAPQILLNANGGNLELAGGDGEGAPLSRIRYYRFGGHAGVNSLWHERNESSLGREDEGTEVYSKSAGCWYMVDKITESDRPGCVLVEFVLVDQGFLWARKHLPRDSKNLRSV